MWPARNHTASPQGSAMWPARSHTAPPQGSAMPTEHVQSNPLSLQTVIIYYLKKCHVFTLDAITALHEHVEMAVSKTILSKTWCLFNL